MLSLTEKSDHRSSTRSRRPRLTSRCCSTPGCQTSIPKARDGSVLSEGAGSTTIDHEARAAVSSRSSGIDAQTRKWPEEGAAGRGTDEISR